MNACRPITISVTVPVHNTAPYLCKCLDSLQSQTYPHLEIICVDDGSTDNSLEVLQAYAARDPRIKVYRHSKSLGVSAARNTALNHSTGEFVTSLDSDDYIAPFTYEKAVSLIDEDIDWVSYGIQLVDSEGVPLPDHDGYYAVGYEGILPFHSEMTDNMNVCIWSRLWRRSIIQKNGMLYPVGLVHEDDAMFYMYAPFVRKAAFISDKCYYYVQRNGSIMHDGRKSLADAEQYIGIIRYVYDFHQHRGLQPLQSSYHLRQFGRAYYQVERFCPVEHRRQLAEMFLKLAQETGLAATHPDDWRIRCLKQTPRWLAPFIRRRSRSLQYRLGVIPLFSYRFDANGEVTLHADLLRGIIAKVNRLFKRISASED